MNVFVAFGGRSATALYTRILCIVGGGGARRAPGARRNARPNMTEQSTERNLIWITFGTREFTRSLIANLNPSPTYKKIRNFKMFEKTTFPLHY